jgi:hypothetical protein
MGPQTSATQSVPVPDQQMIGSSFFMFFEPKRICGYRPVHSRRQPRFTFPSVTASADALTTDIEPGTFDAVGQLKICALATFQEKFRKHALISVVIG